MALLTDSGAPRLLAAGAAAQSAPEFMARIKIQLFRQAPIAEDETFVSLEAPPRAEDAALTPVTMKVHAPAGDARHVVKLS